MEPCTACADLRREVLIHSSTELDAVHKTARDALKEGRLQIDVGDLMWADEIECDLSCTSCGQRFHLSCETYHGSGGYWRPLP